MKVEEKLILDDVLSMLELLKYGNPKQQLQRGGWIVTIWQEHEHSAARASLFWTNYKNALVVNDENPSLVHTDTEPNLKD